jgi:HK97 family phage major capsid protein
MDLATLLAQARANLAAKLAERATATTEIDALRGAISTEGTTVTEDQIRAAIDKRTGIDADVDALAARVSEVEAEVARDESIQRLQAQVASVPQARKVAVGDGVIGAEKRTYSPDAEREGVSFVRDLMGSLDRNLDAMQRLQRHNAEERVERGSNLLQRDVGTGQFTGLTVPQYLTELVAPKVAAGRPLADNCRKLPLPDSGNTVNISRITTGSSVSEQATETAGSSETDLDDTLLTVNVRTLSGQQDVSRQALDRSVGVDTVVIEDLVKRYHTELDDQIINNDGTSGTHLGILSTSSIKSVTYTDTTGTPSEAWGPLWDLQQQIESAVYSGASHFVMHPRRWAFFCAGISTNQTLVQSSGTPVQIMGLEASKEYGPGVRGLLAGLPVIVDANIPTNVSSTTDPILLVTADELFLWEQPGSPLFIRAEEPGAGNLMVKFVVYGYSAFTAGRYPEAHGKITGSGLGAPTYGIAAS